MQELWGSSPHLVGGDVIAPRTEGDSGLGLVAALDVRDIRVHLFSSAIGTDRLQHKGLLVGRMELAPVGSLWLAVTHLQAGRRARAAEVRAVQVEELLGVVNALAGPVVLMGDLNLYDGERDRATVRRLEEAGFADAAIQLGRTGLTHPGEGARLDRVLVRGAGSVCMVPESTAVLSLPERALSDHLPVRTGLRMHRHRADGSVGGIPRGPVP